MQYVHLFAQQFWLEVWKDKWLAFSQSWPDDCPPRLRITIRHTDWWYDLLGEKSPLALDPKRKGRARAGDWVGSDDEFEKGSWGSRFANLSGLKVLELELETIESKTAELDATVDQARSWKFPLRDGNVLILDESVTETSNWTGSRHFKGFNAPSVPAALQSWHGRSKMTVGSPTATPAGAAASASRQASFSALGPATTNPRTHSESLEELAPEHTLDYYVVLLSWRAREPNPDSEPGCLESPTASPTTSPATARAPVVHGPRTTFSSGSVIPTYYGTG